MLRCWLETMHLSIKASTTELAYPERWVASAWKRLLGLKPVVVGLPAPCLFSPKLCRPGGGGSAWNIEDRSWLFERQRCGGLERAAGLKHPELRRGGNRIWWWQPGRAARLERLLLKSRCVVAPGCANLEGATGIWAGKVRLPLTQEAYSARTPASHADEVAWSCRE